MIYISIKSNECAFSNLLLLPVFLLFFVLSSPIIIAQPSSIPNSDFEEWQTSSDYNPQGGWCSLNVLNLIGAPISVTPNTDAASGSKSARIESVGFFGNLIPGLLYLGSFDSSLGLNGLRPGIPFVGKPAKLTGFYKYFPVNGDSAALSAQLWGRNPNTNVRDTIAQAQRAILNPVSEFNLFEIDFVYYQDQENIEVDSLNCVFSSSAGGQTQQGGIGSTLFIDNIALEYPLSINPNSNSTNNFHVAVQRTAQQLELNITENLPNNATASLIDLNGKQVAQTTFDGQFARFNIDHLPEGIYVYRIVSKLKVVAKGNLRL